MPGKKGKRIPNKKRSQIITEKLKDPMKSDQDIADSLAISRASVQRIVKHELSKLSDNRSLEELVENDVAIVSLGQEAIVQKIVDSITGKNKFIFLKDLVLAAEASAKRIMLIQGDPTERIAIEDLQGVVEEAYAELEQRKDNPTPPGVAT